MQPDQLREARRLERVTRSGIGHEGLERLIAPGTEFTEALESGRWDGRHAPHRNPDGKLTGNLGTLGRQG